MLEVSEELKQLVQSIWIVQTDYELEGPLEFKVLTDCASGLIFNLGDKIEYQIDQKREEHSQEIVFSGPSKKLLRFIFHGKVKAIGIRFFPSTGYFFLKNDMKNYRDLISKVDDDFINGLSLLYKELQESTDISKSVNHFLKERIRSDKKYSVLLNNILKDINNNHLIDLNELASKNQTSLRQIQRLFNTYIGVTPLDFLKLKKINKFKDSVINKEIINIVDETNDLGYYDQSHFTRDFKIFMEETPKKYIKIKKKR
ncbi:helix-turn-helix domain-containing protein [Halobacteriovorax sp. GB3]|uniref:DUF6597 domain-containing transcriptional factor n=1 Tax=Halobacteriovorax sp. GB3 TaxID=2719615 RepID=UPI002362D6BA|nr:helix-turn-helix domain-containing protein [Halobacteriovorax sp. GB3]MDD0854289.1 helix-turn-helix domain-containing protein [Halobacteriovorax sp. GB3]